MALLSFVFESYLVFLPSWCDVSMLKSLKLFGTSGGLYSDGLQVNSGNYYRIWLLIVAFLDYRLPLKGVVGGVERLLRELRLRI